MDRLLPLNGGVVLAADPKSGKSELAMEIALCVASGHPVMQLFYPTQVGPVLYVAAQGRRKKIRDRMNALAAPRNLNPVTLPIHMVTRAVGFRIDTDEWKEAIKMQMQKTGYHLVVLDTFDSLHFANENAQQEITPILQFLNYLTEHFQCTVLLLHHLRKLDARSKEEPLSFNRLRGTGAIRGWYDTGILLGGEDLPDNAGKRVTVLRDHRDSDDDDTFTALMKFSGKRQATWTVDPSQTPHRDARIFRTIAEAMGEPIGIRKIADALNMNDKYAVVQKRLRRLIELELIEAFEPPPNLLGPGRPITELFGLTERGWVSATGRCKPPRGALSGTRVRRR